MARNYKTINSGIAIASLITILEIYIDQDFVYIILEWVGSCNNCLGKN